jgi:hypothetical protein
VHRVRGPRIHPVTADVNVGALGEAAAPHGVQECREIAQREVREQDGWATLDQAARDRSEGRLRALRCVCVFRRAALFAVRSCLSVLLIVWISTVMIARTQVFTSGAYGGAAAESSSSGRNVD